MSGENIVVMFKDSFRELERKVEMPKQTGIESLGEISRTGLVTLYARAHESLRPDAKIHDAYAVAMVEKIGKDLSPLRMGRHDEISLIMRMSKIDDEIRDFLRRNPDGVVVHFGCGWDSRFPRVDNGSVEWFDIDLPEVITLRERLLPESNPRYHTIGASILGEDWIGQVEDYLPRPILFAGEGVLVYFYEKQVKAFVLMLRDRFPGCELVCDVSQSTVTFLDNLHLWTRGVMVRLHWGLKNPEDVEGWGEGISLLGEWNYFDAYREEFKKNFVLRILGRLWRLAGICHYQLGERP